MFNSRPAHHSLTCHESKPPLIQHKAFKGSFCLVANRHGEKQMPREINSEDEFLSIVDRASTCIVKRLHDVVKLKLRTPRYLYTFKCDPPTAERLLRGLKIPIVDV